jgi:hypothetical protein
MKHVRSFAMYVWSDWSIGSLVKYNHCTCNYCMLDILDNSGVSTGQDGETRPPRIWWGGDAHVFVTPRFYSTTVLDVYL